MAQYLRKAISPFDGVIPEYNYTLMRSLIQKVWVYKIDKVLDSTESNFADKSSLLYNI